MREYKLFEANKRDNLMESKFLLFTANFAITRLSDKSFCE